MLELQPMKEISYLFCALLIQGCAMVPLTLENAKLALEKDRIMYQQKDSNADAHIIILRDRVEPVCSVSVFIDKQLAGRLDAGHKIEFWVPPGERDITVESGWNFFCPSGYNRLSVTKEIYIKPGNQRVFEVFFHYQTSFLGDGNYFLKLQENKN